jgi:DNA repair protein RadC
MSRSKKTFALDVVAIRLVKDAEILSDKPIQDVEDLVALLGGHMCELDREVVCVVNLKSDGTPINCHYASMGAINYATAHPRELFKSSILSNAANMILIHNHVSGSLQPSKDDIRITDRMVNLCEHLGIPLLDHIIVGGSNREYFSFRAQKILPAPSIQYEENYENIHFPVPVAAERGRSR